MKVLIYEFAGSNNSWIVLWDGESTYWNGKMKPSSGYKNLKLNKVCQVTKGRFVYIGEL